MTSSPSFLIPPQGHISRFSPALLTLTLTLLWSCRGSTSDHFKPWSHPRFAPAPSPTEALFSHLSCSEDQMWSCSCRARGAHHPYFPSKSEAIISISTAASSRHSHRSVLHSRQPVKHSAEPRSQYTPTPTSPFTSQLSAA